MWELTSAKHLEKHFVCDKLSWLQGTRLHRNRTLFFNLNPKWSRYPRIFGEKGDAYRDTSPTRKCTPLGPYRRPMPKVLRGSQGGGRFLMGEVTLQPSKHSLHAQG